MSDAYRAVEGKAHDLLADLDRFEEMTKDPYWARSAKQHFLNGLHAYKLAFHNAPKEPVAEELF